MKGTFSSLNIRNFRIYFIGQVISTSGTFMQSVAQAWLVLKLTNSGTALGLVMALQYMPMLFLSPWGGLIADRFSKRKLLNITQAAAGILALLLGILVATGLVRLWMVYILAFFLGAVNVVDNPTRQAFVSEMVGKDKLRNAVTLYTTMVNLARVIGPAVAGIIITTGGLALCFIINSISYIAVLIALFMMRADKLSSTPPVPHTKGQLLEGFNYIRSKPVILNTLIMIAIIGTLAYEFQVSLALLAEFTFNGNAEGYAALTSALGLGSVIGGLLTATSRVTSPSKLVSAAALFGLAILLTALAPNLIMAMACLIFVGVFSIMFISTGNTMLQLNSAPGMRGRVMSFWTIGFLGSTAIGGPTIGWIGEYFGPRWGLAVGGFATIFATILGALKLRNVKFGHISPTLHEME